MDQQNFFAFSLGNEHWTQVPDTTLEKCGKLHACPYSNQVPKRFNLNFHCKSMVVPMQHNMSVPRMAYNSREVKKIYRFTESSNYCKGNLEMSRLEQEHQKLRNKQTHTWQHEFCQNACFTQFCQRKELISIVLLECRLELQGT